MVTRNSVGDAQDALTWCCFQSFYSNIYASSIKEHAARLARMASQMFQNYITLYPYIINVVSTKQDVFMTFPTSWWRWDVIMTFGCHHDVRDVIMTSMAEVIMQNFHGHIGQLKVIMSWTLCGFFPHLLIAIITWVGYTACVRVWVLKLNVFK